MSTIKRLDDSSAFPALTGAGTATGDQFLMWDVSAAAYKSITRAELLLALAAAGAVVMDGSGDATVTRDLTVGRTLTATGTGAGSTVYPARLSNTSGAASSAVALSLDPGANGTNVRDAQIRATNNGSNQITLAFLVANAATPVTVLSLSPGGPVTPGSDNTQTLGGASFRWSVVYAGTGTINTSGRDSKTEIGEITDAERRAAARIQPRRYKFNDSVDAKGEGARWHFGYIAEDVRDALAAEGLDPWAYGFLCADPVVVRETYTVTAQRPKLEQYQEVEQAIEIVDGVPVLTERIVTKTRPVGSLQPVVDRDGSVVLVTRERAAAPTLRQAEVVQAVMQDTPAPLTHFVPELEDYEQERSREVETGEIRFGLRMDELAAFLRCADE